MERRQAALEPGGQVAAGSRLLALGAATGRLAAARAVAPADAARRLARSRCRMEIVELHLDSSSFADARFAAGSSTSRRKATRRSMPRIIGLSATSTVWFSRCRPSARIVPRAAALWPMVERTPVTWSGESVVLAATSTSEAGVHRLAALGDLVGRPCQLRASLAEQLLGRAATQRGNVVGRAKRREALDGRAHHVDGIGRILHLAEQVADAGRLDDRAHRAARDHAGAGAGRLEHDLRGAEVTMHLVRDGRPDERHLDEVLLGVLDALANRLGHFAGLADPGTDRAVAVADDHHRAEAEAAASLDHLAHAVDLDDLLFQVELGRVDTCHALSPFALQVEAALAGALGERTDPPVILIATAVENHRAHPGGLRALGDRDPHGARDVDLRVTREIVLAAGRGGQRAPGGVVDHLGIDEFRAAEDRQARALGAPADAEPKALVSLATQCVAGEICHGLPYPPTLPALPALRRICSPA